MSKLIPAILLSFVFMCGSCIYIKNKDVYSKRSKVEHSLRSVVALVRPDLKIFENEEGNSETTGLNHVSYCAGVFISKREILTAAHCVEGKKYIKIATIFDTDDTFYVKQYSVFKVGKISKEKDLALLHADSTQLKRILKNHHLKISSRNRMYVGEKVYTIGSPGGLTFTFTEGFVSKNRFVIPGEELIFTQASSDIFFGNSGGPLIDHNGYVVGIASRMPYEQNHLGLFVHVLEIRKFLSRGL